VINYTWDLPKATTLWNHPVVRAAFDGWQLSGENAFVSGDWSPITISTTDNFNFTGGDGGTGGDIGGGVRVVRPNIGGDLTSGNRDPDPSGTGSGSTRRSGVRRAAATTAARRATPSSCPAS
jgi:hypothetical protein